ncbi:aqualysin-1-like [Ptychodera flava]|uniref:aqualysin-1-like n=1 Tax=Ptychodera flava TaxID=63121 RepID=UPI003969ED43
MGNFSALLSCLLALTTLEDAVHGDADYNSRSPRDLRPRFVKREVQAPIIHAGDPGARLDDEYIVKLRDDMTDDDMTALEDNLSQLCEKRGIRVDFHEDIKTLMKGFTARLPDDAVEILRWLDGVEFVEEDESVLEDAIPWGLDRLDQSHLPLDGTYNSNIGDGKGVNVFVIDSGIHYSHVEFEGRAKPFFDAFSDTKEGADCDGHGTHCAGIIGGRTVGVAPGVNLYSCRVFDCKRQGSFSGVIKGMDVIAASKIKPSVVSMSLRGGRSNAINLAVKRLTEEGYIVVVAAGNDGKDASKYSPASAEEAKVHITPATPRTGSGLALRWQRLTYLVWWRCCFSKTLH